jgi:hypothetical protein
VGEKEAAMEQLRLLRGIASRGTLAGLGRFQTGLKPRRNSMRKTLIAAGLAAVLTSPAAFAQDSGGEGTAIGAAGGAVAGAVAGGPVGAIIGAVAGGALGAAVDPPQPVEAYVVEQDVPSVQATGELAIGAGLPEAVPLYAIPDYEYQLAVVNDRRVLVDPGTRRVVYIFE